MHQLRLLQNAMRYSLVVTGRRIRRWTAHGHDLTDHKRERDTDVLRHHRSPAGSLLVREVSDLIGPQIRIAALRMELAGGHGDHGRLARTVWTDDAGHGPRRQRQADII